MSTQNTNLLYKPFQSFFNKEAGSGILLILCTIVALVMANSALSDAYASFWQTKVTMGFGSFEISKAFLLWINDGLMAIFFFVVGLEIKRELIGGELSTAKKAALPLAAAFGGAVLPALIYTFFNLGTPGIQGWGVPMATDIAFALGVLALLGTRAPLALKIFVTALAIADDLMAVLVIAVFYTSEVSIISLGIGVAVFAIALLANRIGIHRTAVYVVLGIAMWVAFLKSGIHATVAGVLFAVAIPARNKLTHVDFIERSAALISKLDNGQTPKPEKTLHYLERVSKDAQTPLHRMEKALHGWVAYGIMPIFALSNAGVVLSGEALGAGFGNPVFLGIFLGLLLGKPLGIFAFAWLAIKSRIAELPSGISWRHLFGAGALAGIGFTMALFIGNLAFSGSDMLETSKMAILAASLASGILGAALLLSTPAVKDVDAGVGEMAVEEEIVGIEGTA